MKNDKWDNDMKNDKWEQWHEKWQIGQWHEKWQMGQWHEKWQMGQWHGKWQMWQWHEEFAKFHLNFRKCQNWDFDWILFSKVEMHELNIYRGVMCNDTEEWWKIRKGTDLPFQNWHKEFEKCWLEHSKVSKIYILMGCFWPKFIIFKLKKYRGVIFDGTEDWFKIWKKTHLCFQKLHKELVKSSKS